MISEEIKKSVTTVTKLQALIIRELGVTIAVTKFKIVSKVTKVTQSYMQKPFVYRGLKAICNFVTFVTAF